MNAANGLAASACVAVLASPGTVCAAAVAASARGDADALTRTGGTVLLLAFLAAVLRGLVTLTGGLLAAAFLRAAWLPLAAREGLPTLTVSPDTTAAFDDVEADPVASA